VIAAHDTVITARLAGHIMQFTEKLKMSLKDKWLINDGYNIEQLSAHATHIFSNADNPKVLEVDYRKFDKS
jgi:hypothetical protein